MDLEQQLLFQRQQARLNELQAFLALLVVRHGYHTGAGFRYDLTGQAVSTLRRQLPGMDVTVVVTYEASMDLHVIDAV